jgi:hypothetical protein
MAGARIYFWLGLALGWALLPPAVLAQSANPSGNPPPAQATPDSEIETVTVTGQKQTQTQIIHNFVNTYSIVSPIAGVITRWSGPVCPSALGLTPQFNDIVIQAVRRIAASAGAAVKDAPCKPNVIITFTGEPEAMLAAAKEKNSNLLGTAGARNATMTHPIQAWYATATVDLRGNVTPDSDAIGMTNPPGKNFGMLPMAGVGGVPTMARAGSILKDGMASTFSTVFIIVDLKKVGNAPLSAIADYVSMLALAQTEAYDRCEPIPSISNLMAEGCAADKKSNTITPGDIAFLRGVYKSPMGSSSLQQQANIHSEMESIVPAN